MRVKKATKFINSDLHKNFLLAKELTSVVSQLKNEIYFYWWYNIVFKDVQP